MKSVIEILKPVAGYEGKYAVNNLGEVWSLNYRSTGKPKILKPVKDNHGYPKVKLCKNGKVKQFFVHRLVASAFIDNPERLPFINHKDENPLNNRVENLEWCDCAYNINYGTCIQRRTEKLSKPVFQFSVAGEFIREWPSTRSVQRELGYGQGHISKCCLGIRNTAYGYIWKYTN